MSDFNTALHRKIKNGLEFNVLFPVVKNPPSHHSNGDTLHSVSEMKELVQMYHGQCNKIAPQLQRTTLKETTQAIYSFLYNHIQYNQDAILQQLRTPANSWINRATGLDCKSFSIFASCILTCLGIKHYIRQIKQPTYKPTRYTHVYVVVPFNQTTGSLADGHYVIDATVSTNREPLFVKNHDTYMDKLPHVWLNGAVKNKPATKKPAKKKPVATKKKPVATKKKPVATKKKPVATKKKVTVRKKKTGLGTAILLGLGAIVGLSQIK